jgi:hypothetical protein
LNKGGFELNYWQLFTIFAGIILLFWGFWATYEAKKPWSAIGAICAIIGLITALLGTLLLFVPGFFR